MRRAATAVLALLVGGGAAAEDRLVQWRLEAGRVLADPGAPAGPLRVGSLQKPFVARAWAEAHPDARAPRHDCRGGDSCWLRGGHGRVGLAPATAASCNAYFRALAADTPPEAVARALRGAGFRLDGLLGEDAAIGLAGPGETPAVIAPEALLRAYARLVREPWSLGEAVRAELLAGLRAAARDGTARGLSARGPFAKTGTAASVDGRPLATSGLALVVDEAGAAWLGLLPRGTGRQAAAALAAAAPLSASSSAPAPRARVRVALFSLLRLQGVVARNAGHAPQRARGGWVGPAGERALRPGERLEEGLWELRVAERGLVRLVRAAIEAEGRDDGSLALEAELDPFEYVAGVAAAELSSDDPGRLVSLGAAVLRFLAAGPRHGRADVCDSTHCAYFLGRGPRLAWLPGGLAARLAAPAAFEPSERLDAGARDAIRAEARRPGPSSWTSHCGGAPLPARFVWGGGDAEAATCPRHGAGSERPWTRRWARGDVEAAFGPGVRRIEVASDAGTWRLRVERADGEQDWSFDSAHRALARVLGWGALPSPADRVAAVDDAFRAEGRGLGHRVGLCLAD